MTLPGPALDKAKCLVTGATGFLGHHIAQRLLAEGAAVRATLHDKPRRVQDGRIEYVSADLRRPEDCAAAMAGVDYVFMAAANTQGAAVIRETPLAHVTPNVAMNTFCLEAAHRAGVKRFLFISTGAAYPDTGHRPVEEHEMFDGDPSDVYFAAGWMKRYAEILCRTYATKIASPMSCVVVRPSNVYGPGDKFDPKTSHVTASIIRRVAEREDPLAMWGTGEDIRDLIYIDDFMDGLVADRINAISDKLQVEIGTKLFEVGPNRYQTGPAYSGGSTHQVNLAKAAGVAGGVEVGTIHTHPHNSPIDPGDRYATYRRSELNGGRDQIGYVSDVNGHLFSWNTAVIAQHPEFGALYENYVWQNYSYGRFDQQVR